jgi:alpha-D-ribose 1-methylphosphonate 5-triphosphate diphosphatase
MIPTDRLVLTNVRAVLGNRIVPHATIVCADGIIEDVVEGTRFADAIDGHELLAIPALVDLHSDALEKEVSPRKTVRFAGDFALSSFESRVRANGITTMFHGIGFEERGEYGRTIQLAHELCDAIRDRRTDPVTAIEHRVLHRLEARTPVGLDALVSRLDDAHDDVLPLVSFEDHTPGQGQYRDLASFRASIDPSTLASGQTVDDFVAQILAEAEATAAIRQRNLDVLSALAVDGRVRLLAHDCEGWQEVDDAHRRGASMAEFPLTVEAAAAARERSMPVVMGAPNALRGQSHSGNASAAELVGLGLCDVLASDYQPSTLLAAAFELARRNDASLARALALVTSGPARAARLHDRGVLEPGRRADLVLVDDRSRWPRVRQVWHAPDLALRTTAAR